MRVVCCLLYCFDVAAAAAAAADGDDDDDKNAASFNHAVLYGTYSTLHQGVWCVSILFIDLTYCR